MITEAFVPHVFRDGRAGKFWIALPNDTDGPFDTEVDAQENLDRYQEEKLILAAQAGVRS